MKENEILMKKLSRKLVITLLLFSSLSQPLITMAAEVIPEYETITDGQEELGSELKEGETSVEPSVPEEEQTPNTNEPEVPEESAPPVQENGKDESEPVLPPIQPEEPVKPELKPVPEVLSPTENNSSETTVIVEEAISYQEEEVKISSEIPVDASSISFTKNQTTEQFVMKLGKDARKIGKENGLYASVMIAQAILESASGNSLLAAEPNFNLFGIKGEYEGQSVAMPTQEDDGSGNLYTVDAYFRKYPSYKESMEDYADLMINGLSHNADFYKGTLKSQAKSYQEATQFLTGKYATDVTYNQKLNGLIETYRLTRYDQEVTEDIVFSHPLPEGGSISSHYGQRGNEFHRGVDFAAIKSGVVVTSEFDASWGEYVVVSHEDGMASLYAHQSQRLVKVGDQIEAGEILGLVGSTGDSSGPHLHLETSLDGSSLIGSLINPLDVLD